MSKPTLLISRLGILPVKLIANNAQVRERFRVICVGQQPIGNYDSCLPSLETAFEDRALEDSPGRVRDYYEALIKGWNVEVAILVPRLFWYSEIVAELCRELNVSYIWAEGFFGTRICLDKIGAQFTADNDIKRYVDQAPADEPILPESTRYAQPDSINGETLRKRYGFDGSEVCILGQVEHDNSMKEYPGLGYYDWLEALISANPLTRFAFKHHPLWPTKDIFKFSNVTIINESLDSIFQAFDMFAAFSSTTVLEGIVQRKKFITGGYHFMSGSGLVLEAPSEGELAQVTDRMSGLQLSEERRRRWLSFICNRYALDLNSEQLVKRLTMSSEDFFRG